MKNTHGTRIEKAWLDLIIELNNETVKHSTSVSTLCVLLARKCNLEDSEIYIIKGMALLHDVGKILLPSTILDKSGSLTIDEYKTVKQHPTLGKNLLQKYNMFTDYELSLIEDHHERINGSGYPNSKTDKDISIGAGIVAIIDVFDALSSKRSYKDQWSQAQIKSYFLNKERDSEFKELPLRKLRENFDALFESVSKQISI